MKKRFAIVLALLMALTLAACGDQNDDPNDVVGGDWRVTGVGEKAAYSIYEAAKKGNFVSREDLIIESGVSKTVIAKLGELGALGSIPETNQISMF